MSTVDEREPVTSDAAARVVEFARACRAATRAVGLYPSEHPAIANSLARLIAVASSPIHGDSWVFYVSPGAMLLEGRTLPKIDTAVAELADVLHAHQVGELVVRTGVDAEGWLKFLRLLSSPPEELRRQGGIARVWATAGGRMIEVREIDYGSVLAEHPDGQEASWDAILVNCLQGESINIDEQAFELLSSLAADADRLTEFARRLEQRAAEQGGVRSPAAALLSVLTKLLDMLADRHPERVDPIVRTVATTACRLSPDVVVELLALGENAATSRIDLRREILARITDNDVAGFVAGAVAAHGATARLAEAFSLLVPEAERRREVLELARRQAEESPIGRQGGFDRLWQGAESLLTSYTDAPYVTDEYAHDLATVRLKATGIDVITDDPSERLEAWLASVNDASVRALDVRLLLDLLAMESDPVRWREVADVVVHELDDLLLIGDFASGSQLVEGLAAVARDTNADDLADEGRHEAQRQMAAKEALGRVITGQARVQIAYHLQTIDDNDFANVKKMCLALGSGVITPLAEMLATQERTRVRQRLTDLLVAFGARGRQCAEQLKQSANPSVRRVAVYLLREFGGQEALPDLESLLDDAEPHVQRETVRAILQIGTDEAYSVLERALRSGSARARETILRLLDVAGDDRAASLFAYMVRRGEYRRSSRSVYLKAVSALGRLGGAEAIDALKEGLYRGDWWAPWRTLALRSAAARSLRQIGTPAALDVLNDAVQHGPRGVRAAARRYASG